MALNTVRLYKIRRLVDSIFHDSNNPAFTFGIRACFHAAFVGIMPLSAYGCSGSIMRDGRMYPR